MTAPTLRRMHALELLAELRADHGLAADYARVLAPALPSPSVSPIMTIAEVAAMEGRTKRALQELFRRYRARAELHPLEAMAFDHDGVKRWRRAEVVAYLATVGK
jgi:hypothetical protein